jgi:mono/diheme cytochrome c family protein
MRARLAALALCLAAPASAVPPEDLALYGRWCARCHGERGDGRGAAAVALAFNGTAPRDFTTGLFKFKSTPDASPPADADLRRVIRDGLPGTAMPYFADLLAEDEIARLAAVVRSFGPARAAAAPIDLGPPFPDGPDVRQRGAALYAALGCPSCHDGEASDLRNADGSPAVPADLTHPWTFRGGGAASDVAMRLATGIAGTPMPSYAASASREDLWAVAHHVRSLARAPSLEAAAVELARRPPGDGEPLAARGEYVVKAGTCFLCHVQMNPDGSYAAGSFGAGGMRIEIATLGTVFSRNLTPDPATGLGGWTAEDVGRALRDGRSRDGRVLNVLDMPWTILAGLTDRDVAAIHAYLQTLPPVANLVPPPEDAGLAAALGTKLAMLVRGDQIGAGFFPGNAGTQPVGDATPEVDNPRGPLVALTLGLVAIGAGWILWRSRLLVTAGALLPLLYTWPPLRFFPPALLRAEPPFATLGRALGMPPLRPPPPPVEISDPDTRLLAARGRYVATIGTCPLCHTAGPSITRLWAPFPEMGGGLRVNWQVFGTTYSRNLTPDPETGLGGWTTPEIRRAITAGIARDGRLMHWQAMPWDHFSHLRLEDLEALAAYLRHLPPVRSRVPDPAPPAPGDARADTFFFGYSGVLGP